MFLDVDLDGWQDILVANGHLWDIMDADTQERLQNRLTDVPWRDTRWEFPALRLKNVAFRNRGDLTFEDESAAWRFGTEDDISHAMAAADLDGDGDLDVVVNRLGSPALVLRNDASAPRVAVRLAGDAPNTRAVGAKIRLLGGAVPDQDARGRRRRAVHVAQRLRGVVRDGQGGQRDARRRLARRTTNNDQRRSTQSRCTRSRQSTATPRGTRAAADTAQPPALFEDATTQLRAIRTRRRVRRLGPAVPPAKRAVAARPRSELVRRRSRRDEDLIVGTGKGGQLGVFKND